MDLSVEGASFTEESEASATETVMVSPGRAHLRLLGPTLLLGASVTLGDPDQTGFLFPEPPRAVLEPLQKGLGAGFRFEGRRAGRSTWRLVLGDHHLVVLAAHLRQKEDWRSGVHNLGLLCTSTCCFGILVAVGF